MRLPLRMSLKLSPMEWRPVAQAVVTVLFGPCLFENKSLYRVSITLYSIVLVSVELMLQWCVQTTDCLLHTRTYVQYYTVSYLQYI